VAFPVFTAQHLADFTGRDAATFDAYATQAIKQAILLFVLGTELRELPEDEIDREVAVNGILSMADAIYLVRPYAEVLFNPFNSESIGSYSYSKASQAVAGGLPTGITWFDLAIGRLAKEDLSGWGSGGIEIFEDDGYFVRGNGGNSRLVAPEDNRYGYTYPDPSAHFGGYGASPIL